MKEVTVKREFIFKVNDIYFNNGVVCCIISKKGLPVEDYNEIMLGMIQNEISFSQSSDKICLLFTPSQITSIKF